MCTDTTSNALQMALLSKASATAPCSTEEACSDAMLDKTHSSALSRASQASEAQDGEVTSAPKATAPRVKSDKPAVPRRQQKHLLR